MKILNVTGNECGLSVSAPSLWLDAWEHLRYDRPYVPVADLFIIYTSKQNTFVHLEIYSTHLYHYWKGILARKKSLSSFPGSLTKLAWDWIDCSCLLLRLLTLLLINNTQEGEHHSEWTGHIPPGVSRPLCKH